MVSRRLKRKMQKAKEANKSSVIVEIRAGTGGEEATLFAKDLFLMYEKYSNSQDWKLKILDSHGSDLGGLKRIVFQLSGKNVFSQMRYEAGVHRVQRIPETERKGRIHTSTATVAVLPKPEGTEIKIRPEDLKLETFRASGPGGQYVNRRETAVRITHLPSGIAASSQMARIQGENKKIALEILKAKLLEKEEKMKIKKAQKKRRGQIGKAERYEKIRTYNFPQNRVTDHRAKKSWHNLDKIIEGKLEKIIKPLQKSA